MPRRVRMVRYDEKAETPQLNWVQELAGYGINLKPEKPVEPISLHEVAGKVITEGKPLTLARAIELGTAAGCESMNEIHAAVPGSYAAHTKAIQDALAQSVPKGVDAGMSDDIRITACLGEMPSEILIKVWSPTMDGNKTTYYMVPVSLDKSGNIEFGDATEVDVTAKFEPVDISKGNAQKKTERQRVAEIETAHAEKLTRDQAFFENVAQKQDRAEKRERLPRKTVSRALTGTEFLQGVSAAAQAKPQTSIEIGQCLAEVARGAKRISDIPEALFSEVYEIAQNHAGEITDGRIMAACDAALVADFIFTCGEVAGGASHVFIRAAELKRAVEAAKRAMESEGGFWVYSTHAVAVAQNGEDPEKAVAVAKTIEFDETTGAVTLPQIEFLENSDGAKRIIETAKTGKKYGISARFAHGAGTVHRDGLYGENVCLELEKVALRGFDIVSKPALGLEKSFLYWL